jgi:hypothetical protein
MDEEIYSKHYIIVDGQSCITDGWSDGPLQGKDTTDAICINDKGGYQFRLILDGKLTEENPPLYDFEYGVPLYKWDGTQVLARTAEEIEADIAAIPAPPPTEMEQIRADVDYLLMMEGD